MTSQTAHSCVAPERRLMLSDEVSRDQSNISELAQH
jgi:hypothetical protein